MARAMAVLTLGLLAALPASAGASGLDLRIGGFFPRASSNLFRDDTELYTVSKGDWKGFTGGAEFVFNLADQVELGLHLDGYGRQVDTTYRDFVRPDGREILQSLKLNLVPLGATLRFTPVDRYATVAPYIGAGPDLVFYKYEEFGDFIDFDSPTLRIAADDFVSDGVAPGFHLAGGVRVRLNHDVSVVGEARYQWGKVKLGDDFRQQPGEDALRLDMSGLSTVVGVSIRF